MPRLEASLPLPLAIAPLLVLLGISLGMLVTALVLRRQAHQVTQLADRLASGATLEPGAIRLRDQRLTAALQRLSMQLQGVRTMATIDPLTGVLNRQAIFGVLEDEIRRASRYARPLSVVFVDIDHFKRVNDTYGHAAGDLLLHQVAAGLRQNLRASDHVGRYGGEEFMLVLPETDVPAAAAIGEKLRRLVGASELLLEDGTVLRVSISAGVAGGLSQHLQLDTLVRDADAALYAAKGLGRDQVYVFREVDDEGLVRRAPITPDAREYAIEVGRRAYGAAHAELAVALDDRPAWAGRPSTLIGGIAVAMARALDLPEGEIERIHTASLLHDLGKLAIPDQILSKPADLTQSEWQAITEHPKIGQVILEQAGALRDAANVVLHHHEWFNGRGYPHGLAGAEIPVGARIVSIADAYDAMVRGRPYRAAITHAEALRELQRHAGEQFDPELVEVFVGLYRDAVPVPAEEPAAARHRPRSTHHRRTGAAAS